MSGLFRELSQDPLDRIGDSKTTHQWLAIPPYTPGAALAVRESSVPSVVEIPTLTLYDKRVNVTQTFPVDSNEAKTFRDNRASVVRINTVDVSTPLRSASESRGTGFFVNKDGLIVTGYHVVKDAATITVRMENGKVYKAKIHDVDPSKDLALLQVEKEKPSEEFQPAQLAPDSKQATPLSRMLALGYPHNVDKIHISGITPRERQQFSKLTINGGLLPGEDKDRVVVRSVGNVAKGNSGGPVFDPSSGKVVGVVNLSNEVDTYFNPIEDLQQFLARAKPPERPSRFTLSVSPASDAPSLLTPPGAFLPTRLPSTTDFWKVPAKAGELLPPRLPGGIPNPFLRPAGITPLLEIPSSPGSLSGRSLSNRIQELGR